MRFLRSNAVPLALAVLLVGVPCWAAAWCFQRMLQAERSRSAAESASVALKDELYDLEDLLEEADRLHRDGVAVLVPLDLVREHLRGLRTGENCRPLVRPWRQALEPEERRKALRRLDDRPAI